MFNWFKKKREEEKGEPKNLQLISLCLAFEVAASDNDIDKKEKELILNKIKDDVDTGVLNSDEVFEIIKNENEVKVSFYDLIHEINKNLSKDEKEEGGEKEDEGSSKVPPQLRKHVEKKKKMDEAKLRAYIRKLIQESLKEG